MGRCLGDDKRMAEVSEEFSKRSNGILKGAIGDSDVWIVCIVFPDFRDKIMNPISFFSRKG